MPFLFAGPQWSMGNVNKQQLAAAIALGLGTVYLVSKLLREFTHSIFPGLVPGEPNTALLASPRPNTAQPVAAKDLDGVREYDYIIVGTGTAGCVLANRLTADGKASVLAIEAGHSDAKQIFSRIPAAFGRLFGTAADWDLRTAKEEGCNGRNLLWPRGKMISINAMIYNRGSPDDFDEWERLGNKGWGYESLTKYMSRAEGFTPGPKNGLSLEEIQQHGRTGPWKVGYSHINRLSEMFLDACTSVGIHKIRDFNTRKGMLGAAPIQTFIDTKGQRSSTAVAYLTNDVASRPNLSIATGQTVSKIVFDESGAQPRAVGVEMAAAAHSPLRYLAKARREVIVCAGAVHTPHVLKLSGIGPGEELSRLGIRVVKQLRGVGENLADHIFNTIVFQTKIKSLQYLAHPVNSLPALVEWLRHGTGAMTTNVAEAAAFLRTADREDAPASLRKNDLSSGSNSPDLEILVGPLAYIDHGKHVAPTDKDWFSVGPVMLRPESRGTVTLKSASPFDPPVIHANYLSSQHDVDVMLYGMKLSHRIARSRQFADTFGGWYWPSKDVDAMTDGELVRAVRDTTETIYHPMCTAKMGPASDGQAVVDERLAVHGVAGLRVVDASVFPAPVACHPCAPVVTVAEKAADMIAEDWA